MQKLKYFNCLSHRLQAFPDDYHFRLLIGQAHVKQFTRSRIIDEVIRFYFSKFSDSEKEFLLKKYNEYAINEMVEKWQFKKRTLTPEQLNFIYSKIKYEKVMMLHSGFKGKDYNWPVMEKVFNHIFTSVEELKFDGPLKNLPEELKKNIRAFHAEVKSIRK